MRYESAGEGVKIAIIDGSFAEYDALQKKEELPSDLTTVDFTKTNFANVGLPSIDPDSGADKHGSGCAKIIYDRLIKCRCIW